MKKNTNTFTQREQAPECIGIILDGNRRWAKGANLPTVQGHRAGLKNFIKITKHARGVGVKHIIVYAFSTENWHRSVEEVSYLMSLFRELFSGDLKELKEENMRIKIIGQKERFDKDIQNSIAEIEKETCNKTEFTVWIALSYGGRAEIVNAAQKACKNGKLTEESIQQNLWTKNMPDPDLIIRTGGEKRLSNFLLWQCAYSELFFTNTRWPDFSTEEFDAILAEYGERERRHGK